MSQNIIITQGFGYSGSSALFDFFKELNNCAVIDTEFDLLRLSGGVFDLSSALQQDNYFIRDGAVRQFKKLIKYLAGQRGYAQYIHPDFYSLSQSYINSFVEIKCPCPVYYYNPHLEEKVDNELLSLYKDLNTINKTRSLKRHLYQWALITYLKLSKKKHPAAYEAIITGNEPSNPERYTYYTYDFTQEDLIARSKKYIEQLFSIYSNKSISC